MIDAQIPSRAHDAGFVTRFAKYLRHGASPRPRSRSTTRSMRSTSERSSGACRRRRSCAPSLGPGTWSKVREMLVRERFLAERSLDRRTWSSPAEISPSNSRTQRRCLARWSASFGPSPPRRPPSIACSPRCSSPTSWDRRSRPPRWVTGRGRTARASSRERSARSSGATVARIDTAGDGFFATFDGPARACVAPRHRRRASTARPRGPCRAPHRRGRDDRRQGRRDRVVIGAGSVRWPKPSEVLVSSTVQDLVAGSGLGSRTPASTSSRASPTAGACTGS